MKRSTLIIIVVVVIVLIVLSGGLFMCFRENGPCRRPRPVQTQTPVGIFMGARPIYDGASDDEGKEINNIAKLIKFYHEGLMLQFNDPETLKLVLGTVDNIHVDYTKTKSYSQWDEVIPTPFEPVLLSLELYSVNFLKSPLPDIRDNAIVPCEGYTVITKSDKAIWEEFYELDEITDLALIRNVVSKALNYAMVNVRGVARAPSSPPLLYSLYNVYASDRGGKLLLCNCTCHTLITDVLNYLGVTPPPLGDALQDSWNIVALSSSQEVGLKNPEAVAYFASLHAEIQFDNNPITDFEKLKNNTMLVEKILNPDYVIGYKDINRVNITCFRIDYAKKTSTKSEDPEKEKPVVLL